MKQVSTISEFDQITSSAPADKLIVIDYHAAWCQPCVQIAPFFLQLTNKYRHVVFFKVDVDSSKEVSERAGVSAMPTFQFYKGGQKIAEVKGADPSALEAKVVELQGPADAENTPAGATGKFLLNDSILVKQVECLNQQNIHGIQNVFIPDGFLESDCDEQLIISVPFIETIKLHSIGIVAHGGQEGKGPKTVKIFINLPNAPSFEEAEGGHEVETLTATFGEDGTALLKLRFVRYQSVNSVQIFVVDNQSDADTTVISALNFYGSTVETTKKITSEFAKPTHNH